MAGNDEDYIGIKVPDRGGLNTNINVLGLSSLRSKDDTTGVSDRIQSNSYLNTKASEGGGGMLTYSPAATGYMNQAASANKSTDTGSVPAPSQNTNTPNPPTSDNSAAGTVGAIFNMVNQVIGGVSTIMQLFGLDDKSVTQKEQYESSMKETKRRFDKTFFENVRQFNAEFALKEFATRKGIQLQEAQTLWNQFMEGRTTNQNLRLARINEEKTKFDFNKEKEAYNNKLKMKQAFSKAFINLLGNRKAKVFE